MQTPYYRVVAFDFDGTIVPTMGEYARIAARQMNIIYSVDESTAERLYLQTSGIPFFQQLEVIFGDDPRNETCAQRFEEEKAGFLDTVQLDDTNREALHQIRSLGLSVAITSNNFQHLLDRFVEQYPELFDLVLGFAGQMSKGPTQFSCVRDRFGVDRRHILFVGDSLTDVRKAMGYGLDFVAVAGTIEEMVFEAMFPTVKVVDDLSDLISLLETGLPISAITSNE